MARNKGRTGIICTDCGVRKIDRATQGHDSAFCTPCFDFAGWENTHSDFDHENLTPEDPEREGCPVCDPSLDPRNVTIRKGHTNTVAKTRTSHAGHDHPVTPAARAACRKATRNA